MFWKLLANLLLIICTLFFFLKTWHFSIEKEELKNNLSEKKQELQTLHESYDRVKSEFIITNTRYRECLTRDAEKRAQLMSMTSKQ